MLEPPDLSQEKIAACLQEAYGLRTVQVTFLPRGADVNSAVYLAVTDDKKPHFVKLRRGDFAEIAVALPRYLRDQGIQQIIAPLPARDGRLWAMLDSFRVILYPFVQGRNSYELNLSVRQWGELGTALKRIHTTRLPETLLSSIPQESYSPQWRESVKMFLERAQAETFPDPWADKLAALLRDKRDEILNLIERAEELARALQAQPAELVLCHADLHAGNILIDADGAFYIVDWDNPVQAVKERDLMFIGGAQGFGGYTPQEEETLFYQGYGQTRVDPVALAYYRYERIVQDIAEFCKQLLNTAEGGDDRGQSFRYLASNFLPGNTIEAARRVDKLS